jgi:FkbH-like protein
MVFSDESNGSATRASRPDLYWLPTVDDCTSTFEAIARDDDEANRYARVLSLANCRLDFVQTGRLDRLVTRMDLSPQFFGNGTLRLALLSSSTTDHLLPAIRVAGLRREIRIETYQCGYNQYFREIEDLGSGLHRFRPNCALMVLDAHHLTADVVHTNTTEASQATLVQTLEHLAHCWRSLKQAFRCQVIQQTAAPLFDTLLGGNDHQLPSSRHWMTKRLNLALREIAAPVGVDILSIDDWIGRFGVDSWHDRALWLRSKQEILPTAAPLYGDLVGRLIDARAGRSKKCLVLDLDNTLWGGLVGERGAHGVVLGSGTSQGEAFQSFQHYIAAQARRGTILAVCSKNDATNAEMAFSHPEMIIRRSDIACFRANWQDKPTNIVEIARDLNLGLDSLVFVDDSSFERTIVRKHLPMIGVPELPGEPALYARCLSDAGYFEGVSVTADDLGRTQQYATRTLRLELQSSAISLSDFLRDLDMTLFAERLDSANAARVLQLINKTNQFNLTSRRYNEVDLAALRRDPTVEVIHFRLVDRLSDNGIVSVVILKETAPKILTIDTWLMSCRVIGRQVEDETFNVILDRAVAKGCSLIRGEYIPTRKNGMVGALYESLGFECEQRSADGKTDWALRVSSASPRVTPIKSKPPAALKAQNAIPASSMSH